MQAARNLASRRRSIVGLALAVLAVWAALQAFQRLGERRAGEEAAARAQPGDIRMIASIGCAYCAAARAWFEANRLPFSECLIERDAACAAAWHALRAPGTPVLLVRGRRLVGFDARAVADALAGPTTGSLHRPTDP